MEQEMRKEGIRSAGNIYKTLAETNGIDEDGVLIKASFLSFVILLYQQNAITEGELIKYFRDRGVRPEQTMIYIYLLKKQADF